MTPTPDLLWITKTIERCSDDIGSGWSGRIVVQLKPSAETTQVEKLEFVPPAPRGVTARLHRRVRTETLPGCSASRPFEMHFEFTP